MTEIEIIIAIATLDGVVVKPVRNGFVIRGGVHDRKQFDLEHYDDVYQSESDAWRMVGNRKHYFSNLNSIVHVRSMLTVDEGKSFIRHLWPLVAHYKTESFSDDAAFLLVNADARKQCEAILKAKGLWK